MMKPEIMTGRGRRPLIKRVSPLQTKGMLTLGLLLLSETIAFANAKSFWSFQSETSFGDNNASCNSFSSTSHPTTTTTKTTTKNELGSTKGGKPVFARIFSSIGRGDGRRRSSSIEDCCRDCSIHFDGNHVCQSVPRGGHGVHNHAENVAEAVSSAAGHHHAMPYGIPLNGWKVIFQAILTTINVLCWLIPLRSKKISENKLALSLANAFSGGVFLSLAFGHLIPECVHGFHGMNEVTPYLLVLGGYLLIFFVEKVAFDAHDILHEMQDGGASHKHDHGSHIHDQSHSNGVTPSTTESSDQSVEGTNTASSGRSAIILLGALAVHSILEMAALGLADKFGDCALLTLSIALHQPAESIALLVAFLKSGMPKDQILLYLSVFSAMGPIGVGVGMAVNEFAAPIVDAIMVAVVAGTFVYVGATEVIPEEWEDSEHKWKKFAALMGGIISILVITQYTATLEL